jgi:ribose 5-phosphate isomerase B
MSTIAIAADHAGVQLKAELAAELTRLGHQVVDFGTNSTTSVDYPDYAVKVTDAVVKGEAALGVLVCGTGMGMSITANKAHGIRAALCHTEFEARMSRAHNDANVLCLGQRVTGVGVAISILHAFLEGHFEGGRHAARVEKIRLVEAKR